MTRPRLNLSVSWGNVLQALVIAALVGGIGAAFSTWYTAKKTVEDLATARTEFNNQIMGLRSDMKDLTRQLSTLHDAVIVLDTRSRKEGEYYHAKQFQPVLNESNNREHN